MPSNLKQWLALLKLIWQIRRGRRSPDRDLICPRCGGRLEIVGFESSGAYNPVYACPQCN